MNTLSRKSSFIAVIILACCLLLISLSRIPVLDQINLSIQESIFVSENETQAGFALVDVPQKEQKLAVLLEEISSANPKRIFWLLPDLPITQSHKELIARFTVNTVKLPTRSYSSRGDIVLEENADWIPDAGYLTSIRKTFGVARQLPLMDLSVEKTLYSPVSVLNPTLMNQSDANIYLNYSELALNTAVIGAELSALPDVLARTLGGKDVYLVSELDLLNANIRLPHHDTGPGWHPIQFHALSLIAWESGATIQAYKLWERVLLLAVILSSLYLTFLMVRPRLKRIAIVVLVFFYVVLSFAVSERFGRISPSIEMLTAMLLFFVVVESFFNQSRHQKLQWVDQLLSLGLARRFTNTKRTQSFWNNVADLVTQNLHLDRCIFLELPHEAHHLREISAINCNLEDIDEMRRDCRREPYLSAVQSKQAIESNRPYFKNNPGKDIEILVPLFKGTTVLGFWALVTQERDPEKLQQLKEQINWFAMQISALLEAQQNAIAGEHRASLIIRRYGCEENEALQHIGNRLTGLLSNVNSSASFFESMSTPAVLFDVFGQLSLVNDSMQQLARKENIAYEDITAYEFLIKLLPISGNPLRNIIRQFTAESDAQPQRFPINLSGVDFLVVLSSVQREMEQIGRQEVNHKLQGLMVEFLSLKEVQDYLEIERDLYNNYVVKIKNYLSTLQMGLLQIERKAQEPLIKELGLYLNLELQKASDITRRTHFFMKRVTDRRNANALPFNPVQILQSLVAQSEQNPSDYKGWRGISFDMDLPTFASLGLGAPELYKKLVLSGLKLLADDAVSPRQIKVVAKHIVRDDLEVLYIKLTSEGYGLPNEQLQKLYEQSTAITERSLLSEFLGHLRSAKDVGMECRLKSRVGKGYRLSILIEGIGLHDD